MKDEKFEQFDVKFIDSSRLCCFARCPRQFLFKCLYGFQKPDRSSLALDYGTCMHLALPHAYSDYELACNEFEKAWIEYGHGDSDDKRNLACARRSLWDFHCTHKNGCPYEILPAPTTQQNKRGKDAIPFAVDIGAIYPFCGEIDCAVRWLQDDSRWALDYKTSWEVSPRLFENFEFAPASCGYTLALSNILHTQVSGIVIEVIRVSKSNSESLMQPIYVQDHQLESFVHWASLLAEMISQCNDKKYWPKYPSGCASYAMYGSAGYYCDYKSICNCEDWQDAVRFFERKPVHKPYDME